MFIRVPQVADLPALVRLWQEQVNLLAILSPKLAQSIPPLAYWSSAFQAALSDSQQQIYLAENSTHVLGFMWLNVERGLTGSVVATCIEIHGQGSAVGAALWSPARNWFGLQGVSVVSIPRQSAIADAFWSTQGAVVTDRGLSISL
jgi:hypothetical protein